MAAQSETNPRHCAVLGCVLAATAALVVVKREIPDGYHGLDYGYNSIEDLGHHYHHHIPPAISTISYIQTHHSKPTSYSGFTNHGRGHHDPGYAIEFRQDGFHHHHQPHHHEGHYEHSFY